MSSLDAYDSKIGDRMNRSDRGASWTAVLVAVVLLVGALLGAYQLGFRDGVAASQTIASLAHDLVVRGVIRGTDSTGNSAPAMLTVKYEADAGPTARASIIYSTPTGEDQQSAWYPYGDTAHDLTFRFPPGTAVTLVAQTTGDYPMAAVSCRISVNGNVVSSDSSQGSLATATCHARM